MQLVPFQVALKRLETSTDCTTVTNRDVIAIYVLVIIACGCHDDPLNVPG